MAVNTQSGRPPLELRKYPNRRYYDATRSTHVTLERIHELIKAGHSIHVTDSRSGEDITGRVLAQIMLEHDPAKLGIFPDDLLHKIIRSSEPVLTDFIEKYFNQALLAFLGSQQQFEEYLRHAVGLNPALLRAAGAPHPMYGPFAAPPPAAGPPQQQAGGGNDSADMDARELRQMVEELRHQVADLKARDAGQNTRARRKPAGRQSPAAARKAGKAGNPPKGGSAK